MPPWISVFNACVLNLLVAESVVETFFRQSSVFRSMLETQLRSMAARPALRSSTSFGAQPGAPLKPEEQAILRTMMGELTQRLDVREGIGLLKADHRGTRIVDRRAEWERRLQASVESFEH